MSKRIPRDPDFVEIAQSHIDKVCRPGQGVLTCRYLGVGENGVQCLKYTQFAAALDRRAMLGLMKARGDNCPGWDHEAGKAKRLAS